MVPGDTRPPFRRVIRRWQLVVALLAFALSLGVLAIAIFLADIRCDDSCVAPRFADDWTDDRGAWQWTGQLAAAVIAFVAATLLIIAWKARVRLGQAVAGSVLVISAGLWVAILLSGG